MEFHFDCVLGSIGMCSASNSFRVTGTKSTVGDEK
jgi:hypothetical protein